MSLETPAEQDVLSTDRTAEQIEASGDAGTGKVFDYEAAQQSALQQPERQQLPQSENSNPDEVTEEQQALSGSGTVEQPQKPPQVGEEFDAMLSEPIDAAVAAQEAMQPQGNQTIKPEVQREQEEQSTSFADAQEPDATEGQSQPDLKLGSLAAPSVAAIITDVVSQVETAQANDTGFTPAVSEVGSGYQNSQLQPDFTEQGGAPDQIELATHTEANDEMKQPRNADMLVAAPVTSTALTQVKQHHEGPYDPAEFMEATDASACLPASISTLEQILGLNTQAHSNLHYIEDHKVVTAVGNHVVLIDLTDMSRIYVPGLDGGGVGAVAVHPSRQFLAVACKCRSRAPNIYVYSYPAMELMKVLPNGTERAYSAIAFNDNGDTLASVGGFPDYLLTLWSWQTEEIVLRSKAFSQDIYSVRFSPYLDGNLITSGQGHIRFWKMASTFTGLKLQGQIGKFGAIELSDIAAFVEMPDGKVLSSSETGEMLMWDGGLIKVVFQCPGGKPCHNGPIEVLLHDRNANVIVSGGADGYVKLWDFDLLNDAEADEDSFYKAVSPVDEVLVAPGARVKSLLWQGRSWLVLDGSGALHRVQLPEGGQLSKGAVSTCLANFHAGSISGMVMAADRHVALTAGADGSIRVWDYQQQQCTAMLHLGSGITAVGHLGPLRDPAATLLLLGSEDGVLRAVVRAEDGLKLAAACKPHKARITAVAVSDCGTKVATCASDGSIFFFNLSYTPPSSAVSLTPIAYGTITTYGCNGGCSCAAWQTYDKLLVGYKGGAVLEVLAPSAGLGVEGSSMQVELQFKQYEFRMPKPKKVKKQESAKAEAQEGQQAMETDGTAPGDAGASQVETGIKAEGSTTAAEAASEQPPADATAAATEEQQQDVGEEEEDMGADEVEPCEVLTLQSDASHPDAFLLTLGGAAAGQVWRGSFDEPVAQVALPSIPGAATSFVSFNLSGRLALLGSVDGRVRISPAPGASPPDAHVWEGSFHDMNHGQVSAVCLSHDEKYLITAAHDGSLYLQSIDLAAMEGYEGPTAAPEPAVVPRVSELGFADVVDITDPKAYTIEEERQKAEYDKLVKAAEEKKMGVREQLQHIRAQLQELLAQNSSRPEAERLPRQAFEIDPGLRQMMEAEAKELEEIARKEMAWEGEKRRLALAKIKAYFLDQVEVEHIMLYALGSKASVCSFRTARLSDEMRNELEALKRGDAAANGDSGGGRTNLETRKSMMQAAQDGARAAAAAAAAAVEQDTSRMTKADLRRLARRKREAEWAAFSATKPDDQYENPADVAAIAEAEKTIGDFKLKTDPNYVVPADQVMTPQRKRLQMLQLEEAMHDAKMEFNSRFLALREVKRKVIQQMSDKLARLAAVSKELGQHEDIQVPVMKPDEEPERREVVTDADIQEFKQRKEEEARKAAQGSGLGGFAAAGAAKKAAATGASTAPAVATSSSATASVLGEGSGLEAGSSELALAQMMASVPQSELEKAMAAYNRKRLEFERSRIKEEIATMVEAFDSALTSLRRERLRLAADLKTAEMRQLLMWQELALLREYDKREVVLIQKRQAKLDDQQDLMDKMLECTDKLEAKRLDVEGLVGRRAAVVADFDVVVPESDPFREPLAKIFNRKIKRAKKKAGGSDDGSDDDDDGNDELDELDEDDESEEICPPGCDQAIYERACELREKRLDEEDRIAEFQKEIEALRKEKDSLAKKQRLVEQAMAAVNAEIAEFQKEKQGKLNQLEVIVNLRCSQVEYLVDGRLPQDVSSALVFSKDQLARLHSRIQELEDEKAELRKQQAELKKHHVSLLRDKAGKESRVAELERRAHDVQMLKFGQIIDLELLDRLGASRGTEELREQLKEQEARYARELAGLDREIAKRTEQLMEVTRQNTAALNTVSQLSMQQKTLEAGLTSTRKGLFADPITSRRQEVEERDTLVALVNSQAQELEKLRMQVSLLKRKDTSVYS